MSNRKLGHLVGLRSPEALKTIRFALVDGRGVKAAAAELGVSRNTLIRWGASWPALGKLLKRFSLDPATIASMGGTQTKANRDAAK